MAEFAKQHSSRWRNPIQGLCGAGGLATLAVFAGCASESPSPIESQISYKTNVLTLTHAVHFSPGSVVPDSDQE